MIKMSGFFVMTMTMFNCVGNTQGWIEVLPKEIESVTINIDTIKIETPGTIREFPYRFPSYDYSGQTFAGLDERTNSINVYDVGSLHVLNSINLQNSGPHAIQGNMIGSVWYHSPDSIFVLQNIPNRIMIVNNKAEIIWERDLSVIFKENKKLNGLIAYGLLDRVTMYFQKDKVYFAFRQNQINQDFEFPLVGYYDFEKDDIFTLNIQYPEFYKKSEDVGSYQFPNITWYENSIIVVYPYSPEIFMYDLKGNLQLHVQRPAIFKVGDVPERSGSNRQHFLNNPLYRIIQPVQDGQYYILLSQQKTPTNPETEIYRTTIIYNRDFTKFTTINKNEPPISFGGEYFYYPIPPEQSEYQLMERYRIEME